jgi:hypothetical protein
MRATDCEFSCPAALWAPRSVAAAPSEGRCLAAGDPRRSAEERGERKRALDTRLAEVAQTIGTRSRVCGLTPTVPMGLTEACRLVMRGDGVPMSPSDVRDRLRAIGLDLSKYSNDLAAIHTILTRLNESGELRFVARGPGTHQYVWNRGTGVVALGPDIVKFMHDARHEREAMDVTDDRDDEEDKDAPSPPRPSRTRRVKRAR